MRKTYYILGLLVLFAVTTTAQNGLMKPNDNMFSKLSLVKQKNDKQPSYSIIEPLNEIKPPSDINKPEGGGEGKGLFLGVRGGWAFPVFGVDQGSRGTIDATGGFDKQENIYSTAGQGIPITFLIGYMFNQYIGIQLDVTYLLGINRAFQDYEGNGYKQVVNVRTNQFRLIPQVVINTPINVYSRLGILFPVFGNTLRQTENVTPISSVVEHKKTMGRFTLGVVGAVGYKLKLGNAVALIFEFEFVGLSIKENNTEVTKFEVDGQDQLDNYELITGDPIKEDIDKIDAGQTPFNSIGLNFGAIFNLSKNKE